MGKLTVKQWVNFQGAAALQAHLDHLANLLPPVSHSLALPHQLQDLHRAASPLPLPGSFLQPHHLGQSHSHHQSPQLDPPAPGGGHLHSPHLSASQPLPHASPSQSDGFSSRHHYYPIHVSAPTPKHALSCPVTTCSAS